MNLEGLRQCQEAVNVLRRYGAWEDRSLTEPVVGLWWKTFVQLVPVHLWQLVRVDWYEKVRGEGRKYCAVQVKANVGRITGVPTPMASTWFLEEAQRHETVQRWLTAQGIKMEQAGTAATVPAHDDKGAESV